MNTILLAVALVLFDVLDLLDRYETVILLCFMFGFSFGHYMTNLAKIRTVSNFFMMILIILFSVITKITMSICRNNYIP